MFNQIKTGKEETKTEITDDIIKHITRIRLFEDFRDDMLYELHQELLYHARKNRNNEVCILWDYVSKEKVILYGTNKKVDMKTSPKALEMLETSNSLIAMHNHPRNGLFSRRDLMTFGLRMSIRAMTVVCNDGTIYMLRKEKDFDFGKLMSIYNENVSEKKYSGIKAVARQAKKIGATYRCSVRRRD